MKVLRKFTTKKDMQDVKGWKIPKGTVLHVIKDVKMPPNPMDGVVYRFMLVRVDNGTGDVELMPETAIRVKV